MSSEKYVLLKFFMLYKPDNDNSLLVVIIFFFLNLILLFIVFVLLYFVYYLVFKGYPQTGINFITFHFTRKVDPYKILTSNRIFLNAYFALLQARYFHVVTATYPSAQNIKSKISEIEIQVNKMYPVEKYDYKYAKAFNEYFLFYKTVPLQPLPEPKQTNPSAKSALLQDTVKNVQTDTKKIAVNGRDDVPIQNFAFVERQKNYRLRTGEMSATQNGVKLSDNELLFQVSQESVNFFNEMKTIKRLIEEFKAEIQKAHLEIIQYNVVPYILIPSTQDVIKRCIEECKKFEIKIKNNEIYNSNFPSNSMSEFTWWYIDSRKEYYDPSFRDLDKYTMSMLLNTPFEDRRAFAQKVAKKIQITDYDLEMCVKKPISASIFYNAEISAKQAYFDKVRDTYKRIYEGSDDVSVHMEFLNSKGQEFKISCTSIGILHIYLNLYMDDILRIYEQRELRGHAFFRAIWVPVYKDLFLNKVLLNFVKYWKNSFYPIGKAKYYADFQKVYAPFVDKMKGIVDQTWKSFFTSVKIQPPAQPDLSL